MIKDLTFVIATRKGSQRVKNKNVKKFGNSSLLEIKLKQIKRTFQNAKIVLSTDCNQSVKIGKKCTKLAGDNTYQKSMVWIVDEGTGEAFQKNINKKNCEINEGKH